MERFTRPPARPMSPITGSGGLMRSSSAFIWMSRTYWKSVWLRSSARMGMSCCSRSCSASRWSLYAASSSVTRGTGRTRPASTCFSGTGKGFCRKTCSSCCASVFRRSTRWTSLTSRWLARSAIFSVRFISRSSFRACTLSFCWRASLSFSCFRSRAAMRLSSTRSSSAWASARTSWISLFARCSQACSRLAMPASRLTFRRSVSAWRLARTSARRRSVARRSSSFFFSCSS
mmetsp:Transcript_10726/g.33406  ORF Transcript_10726/g.33406 Transcript_10726/m.33406 type:complete len:232 (-) Transcript_10726:210-905(-)